MYDLKYIRDDGMEFTLSTSPAAALFLTRADGLFGGPANWISGHGSVAFGDPPGYAIFPGRDIILDFIIRGESKDMRNFLISTISPMIPGTLVLNEFARLPVKVRAWPEISRFPRNASGQLYLRAVFPFWSIGTQTVQLSDYVKEFRFPINYSLPHRFGTSDGINNSVAVSINTDAPCWYTVVMQCRDGITNPRVSSDGVLLAGLAGYTLPGGSLLEITVAPNEIRAVSRDSTGNIEDVSGYFDFSSSFAPLMPGTHVLQGGADLGGEHASCNIILHQYQVAVGV